jgi:hypothetical protein
MGEARHHVCDDASPASRTDRHPGGRKPPNSHLTPARTVIGTGRAGHQTALDFELTDKRELSGGDLDFCYLG